MLVFVFTRDRALFYMRLLMLLMRVILIVSLILVSRYILVVTLVAYIVCQKNSL